MNQLFNQMFNALQEAATTLEDCRDYPITTMVVNEAVDAAYAAMEDRTFEPIHTDVVDEWLYHNQPMNPKRQDWVEFARYIEKMHGIGDD